MAKSYALPFLHERYEIEFDLVGVGVLRESQSLRKAHNMGVDADGLLPESVAEDDVGSLSSHTGEGKKVVEFGGDFALKALDDFAATVVNRFCFIAVEIDFVNLALQL